MRQGDDLGTEVEKFNADNEPTGEKFMLDIKNSEELGVLQARLNDVAELLPPEKRPDITEICVALEKYSTEIIDYDKLVELLNNYIDKTDETNKQAIEEYVMSMDEDSR